MNPCSPTELEPHLPTMARSPLFKGIAPEDYPQMLACLGGRILHVQKGELIFTTDAPLTTMGVILTGSISLMKEDYWGNRMVLGRSGPGQVIGEVYACLPKEPMDIWAVAAEPAAVLLLESAPLLHPCASTCGCHATLTRNLIAILSQKALGLTRKMEHTSRRSIRQKVLSYLSEQALHAHTSTFTIPFNRQELADYLGTDRSALSAELSKMQTEGIIAYRRNTFTMLDQPPKETL